jgi:hypothetical protein
LGTVALFAGCSSTEISDKSPYLLHNDNNYFEDVKVDGSMFYRRISPGDTVSLNLKRSTPHFITIVGVGPYGPISSTTQKVTWNESKSDWDEQDE